MHWSSLVILPALALAVGGRSEAQTGGATGTGYSTSAAQLSASVDMSYLERTHWDSSGRSQWIQLVLLWRAKTGWTERSDDSEGSRQAVDEYRRVRAAAILANAVVLGGRRGPVAFLAEVDSEFHAVTLLGHRLAMPAADSALVVMIDHVDGSGGQPAVVGTVVVDGRLMRPAPTPALTSGETVVTTESDVLAQVKAMLSRNPAVDAFWHK